MHVQLDPYPATAAFEAPIAEVSICTLKPGATGEEFVAATLEAMAAVPEIQNGSLGVILEDDRKYVFVNGWESMEQVRTGTAVSFRSVT